MEEGTPDEMRGRTIAKTSVAYPVPSPPSSRQAPPPFASVSEWLTFLCEHEKRQEPLSEYMI
jgi:hypothetical protein